MLSRLSVEPGVGGKVAYAEGVHDAESAGLYNLTLLFLTQLSRADGGLTTSPMNMILVMRR
jgi:hypothetical protein